MYCTHNDTSYIPNAHSSSIKTPTALRPKRHYYPHARLACAVTPSKWTRVYWRCTDHITRNKHRSLCPCLNPNPVYQVTPARRPSQIKNDTASGRMTYIHAKLYWHRGCHKHNAPFLAHVKPPNMKPLRRASKTGVFGFRLMEAIHWISTCLTLGSERLVVVLVRWLWAGDTGSFILVLSLGELPGWYYTMGFLFISCRKVTSEEKEQNKTKTKKTEHKQYIESYSSSALESTWLFCIYRFYFFDHVQHSGRHLLDQQLSILCLKPHKQYTNACMIQDTYIYKIH